MNAQYRLVISGTLPGYNEHITECNRNKNCGAKLKRQAEQMIGVHIRKQLRGVKITKPVSMQYHWYEPNKKRDKSNVCAFGRKAIEDALQKHGVLKNDGWANIESFSDTFTVDAQNPRIEVTITEI